MRILPSGMPLGVHDCMRRVVVDESPNHDIYGGIDPFAPLEKDF